MAYAKGKYGDVRFRLYSDEKGIQDIEDPINWDESDREYTRNKDFQGIFGKFSNNLQFVKRGYDYLTDLKNSFGVNPDVRLTKEVKDPKDPNETWTLVEEGFPNLTSLNWNEENRVAKVKFDEEGFWLRIFNRRNEKHDLTATSDPDGNNIGNLSTRTLNAHGRNIFLRSELRINPVYQKSFDVNMKTFGGSGVRTANKALPFKIKTSSDQENINSAIDSGQEGYSNNQNGTGLSEFYLISDRNKKNVRIEMSFSFTLNSVNADDTRDEFLNFFFRKYTGGEDLTLGGSTTLLQVPDPQDEVGKRYTVNHSVTTDINIGDSFAFIGQTSCRRRSAFHDFSLDCNLTDLEGYIIVREDSEIAPSTHQVLLPHEKFERLTRILTGKANAFYSDYFGRTDLGYSTNGSGSLIGCASGFMVREFPEIVNPGTDEEKKIQYKTSFSDLYQSFNSDRPLAAFIEGNGNERRLRIEPLEYVYQKFLGVEIKKDGKFLKISSIEREVDGKRIYANGEIGSEKGGTDYEEAFGLDEFNGKTEFRTVIDKTDSTYKAVSKYRKDSYGHEFARRSPYFSGPEKDTRYDEDIFMLDCKLVNGKLYLKLWQDDFERPPTGIYSPETAFNLNLSPGNAFKRHSFLINSGLQKNPNDFINFISSNANSSLTTKKLNEPEIPESGRAFKNSDLERPLFLPEILKFDAPINNDLLIQISGLNKNRVPNLFGYTSILSDFGREYIYLDSVKLSDNGKFIATKAYL